MSNNNVISSPQSVSAASTSFAGLSSEQDQEKMYLEKIDSELFELWVVTAGDAFRCASYVSEMNLKEFATRHYNTSEALSETFTQFGFMDTALSENLTVASDPQDG